MKNSALPLFLTAAVMLSACSKDEGGKIAQFGKATEITINLVNADNPSGRGLNGKEDGEGDENKITSLEFFVFDSSGEVLDPKTGEGNGYVRIETNKLTHRLTVSAGSEKKFLVVANSNIGAQPTGTKMTDIMKKLTVNTYLQTPTIQVNPRKIPDDGFEMSGDTKATIGEGSTNQVYVTLYRTVSKINPPILSATIPVELGQQEQIDQIWEEEWGVDTDTDITFEFTGYAVVNGNKRSDISFVGNLDYWYKDPVGKPWELWSPKGNINSDFEDGFYTENYSGPSAEIADSWFLDTDEGPVYVYENKPAVKNSPGVNGYDAKTVYAYIIEGKLTADKPGVPVATRYWRVNLTADDYYHIMRNCVYKVTIKKISTPGYGTPEEAEDDKDPIPVPDETSADFFISIAQWDINEYETDM